MDWLYGANHASVGQISDETYPFPFPNCQCKI